MLKSKRLCVTGTSLGEPKASQVDEDKIVTEAPSSTFVRHTFLPYAFTMICKRVEEGRWSSLSLIHSKKISSLLGGGSMETNEMSPCVEESEVTRRTYAVLSSLSKGRVGSIEDRIESTTWSTNGSWTWVICVSLSNEIVRLTIIGIRSINSLNDDRLRESLL